MRALHCPSCGAAAEPGAARCPYCGIAIAVEACPSCLGWMFVGSKHCVHCGHRVAAPAAREPGASAGRCPRCKERPDLSASRVGTVELDQCPSCTGVFVGRAVLESVMSAKDQAAFVGRELGAAPPPLAVAADKVTYLPCAHCEALMTRVNFGKRSGVIVDVCGVHGTWFDADELRRVAAWVAAGGLDEARKREIAELERKISERKAAAMAAQTSTGLGGYDVPAGNGYLGATLLVDAIDALLSLWRR